MQAPYVPQLRLYQDWLRETRGLSFPSYEHLWRWSVTDQDGFWQSLWDYDQMQSPTPHTAVLADARMPGAQWFPGAQVNYAPQVFRHVEAADRAGMPAIVSENEAGGVAELSWSELRRRVAAFAKTLRRLGVAEAIESSPACPMFRKRLSPSSPAQASARSGACARRTWARRRSSTASNRSTRRS